MQLPSTKRGRRTIIAVTAVVFMGVAFTAVPAVTALPTATIADVEAQIAELQTQAEMVAEDLNGARVRLQRIHDKQGVTQKKAARAKAALAKEAGNLGEMASVAYRSGGLDTSVQLLMADNPADFLQQSAALDIVAKGQNAVLRRTTAARLQLSQATAELSQQEGDAAAVEKEIAGQQAAIKANLAEQQQVLSQLKEEERQRLEAERKAREAAAAQAAASARAAAEQAAADAQARAANAANNNDTTSGSSNDTADTGGPASGNGGSNNGGSSGGQNGGFVGSDQAAIAVAAALAQVGEPYTYDAHPPDTWDCSKLTAWAWGQAGVSLTAYSYDQANEVRHISTDQLQPGDLLFYFNNAHHVAMYIGGGQIVEAASPSVGVHVTDAWNSWSSSHFSYAGRPVG